MHESVVWRRGQIKKTLSKIVKQKNDEKYHLLLIILSIRQFLRDVNIFSLELNYQNSSVFVRMSSIIRSL